MTDEERIQKVYDTYNYLNEQDIIESLTISTVKDGEKTFTIKEDVEITDEWKDLSKRTSYFSNKFYRLESMYKIVIGDIVDFNKLIKGMENPISNKSDEFEESNVIRYFIHILSSGVMFVTYLENFMKEHYGKESKEFKALKENISFYYDKEFVYRFMYELRNYSHHKEIPLHTMGSSIVNFTENKAEVKVEIDVDLLKQSGYGWKSVFLKDFSEIKNKINVRILIKNYFKILTLIYGKANEIYFETDIHKILKLKRELKNYQKTTDKLYISKITKYNLAYNPTNHTLTSFPGLYEIDKLMLDLSKIGLVKIKRK